MHKIINEKMIEVTSQGSSTVTSDQVFDLQWHYGYSLQYSWTSTTCTATFSVDVSNDNENWVNLSASAQAISDDSGDVIINLPDQMYAYVRGKLVVSSGTLTTGSAHIHAKG